MMVRRAGFVLTAIAMAVLVAPAAWADVIPSKRAAASDDAGRVKDRLVRVGVSPVEANEHASSLTERDAAFFARGENGVQVVAGLWLEEWLIAGGAALLVAVAIFVIWDRTPK